MISLAQARRISLAAQGFNKPRAAYRAKLKDLRTIIHQLGLLQIDYVNSLLPSHYLVPFSRLGPYDRALLDDLVYRKREFTEQWAHEASIIPVETWPLLRYRMKVHRVRPYGFESFLKKHAEYTSHVLEQVRIRGPLSAGDLGVPDGAEKRVANSWFGSVPRAVLEAHFGFGALAIAKRRINFAREYDLAERIIPHTHFNRSIDQHEAERELLMIAAKAHGIGTAADLADYFRMQVRVARPRLEELASLRKLKKVTVEGWREPAYLHPEAAEPASIHTASLLSPFDPLIWYRPRTLRLFHFNYRMEVFVPAPKRKWGIYVLPFLLDERLVARVDLKADRAAGRLLVLASYVEPAAPASTAGALANELRTLAAWLGLQEVSVSRKGNFARSLRKSLE